jgi:hypothetical protein
MTMVVGWVLLHFVWQGAAVALALAVLLALTSTAQARLRYALSCGALMLMLAAAVATAANVMTGHTSLTQPRDLAVEANAPGPPSLPGTGTDVPGKNGKGGVSADALETPLTARPGSGRGWSSLAQPILEAAMPWLVLGWAAGVMLFSIRSEWLTRPRAA